MHSQSNIQNHCLMWQLPHKHLRPPRSFQLPLVWKLKTKAIYMKDTSSGELIIIGNVPKMKIALHLWVATFISCHRKKPLNGLPESPTQLLKESFYLSPSDTKYLDRHRCKRVRVQKCWILFVIFQTSALSDTDDFRMCKGANESGNVKSQRNGRQHVHRIWVVPAGRFPSPLINHGGSRMDGSYGTPSLPDEMHVCVCVFVLRACLLR